MLASLVDSSCNLVVLVHKAPETSVESASLTGPNMFRCLTSSSACSVLLLLKVTLKNESN